jgi:hypothetical protein
MTKKCNVILFLIPCLLLCGLPVFSQTTETGGPEEEKIGKDVAEQMIKSVTIDKMEDAGFWYAVMPQDQGFIRIQTRKGHPVEKEKKDEERLKEEEGKRGIGEYVLGVKVKFYRRDANVFSIQPVKPLSIPGRTRSISVWVVGRNYNHVLKLMIADYYGRPREITVGKLNFSGWQKLTVSIPPQITQSDYHFMEREGIKFLGFKIECDPQEAFGTYYIYFDDLSAKTDLFTQASRQKIKAGYDMDDGW